MTWYKKMIELNTVFTRMRNLGIPNIDQSSEKRAVINNCFFNHRKTGNTINLSVLKRFYGISTIEQFKSLYNMAATSAGKLERSKWTWPANPPLSYNVDPSKINIEPLIKLSKGGKEMVDWHSTAFLVFLELGQIVTINELKAIFRARKKKIC